MLGLAETVENGVATLTLNRLKTTIDHREWGRHGRRPQRDTRLRIRSSGCRDRR
jgi:hypothetical protein